MIRVHCDNKGCNANIDEASLDVDIGWLSLVRMGDAEAFHMASDEGWNFCSFACLAAFSALHSLRRQA